MSEEAALLQGIFANPEDTTARLVYADWLDEHGNSPRAEFIRVQCNFAVCDDHYERQALAGRSGELLRAHGVEWLLASGVPQPEGARLDENGCAIRNPLRPRAGWYWARGFVTEIVCDRDFWRDHGEAFFRAQPVSRAALYDLEPAEGERISLHLPGGDAPTTPFAGLYHWVSVRHMPYNRLGHMLPDDVFDCLGERFGRLHPAGDLGPDQIALYVNDLSAIEASSVAFVHRGRQRAGLPPLPERADAANPVLQYTKTLFGVLSGLDRRYGGS